MLKYFKLKHIGIGIICLLSSNFLLCQTLEDDDAYPKSESKDNIGLIITFKWNRFSLNDSIDNNEPIRYFLFPPFQDNKEEYIFSDTSRNCPFNYCTFSLYIQDIRIGNEKTYYLLITKKGFKSQLFTIETKLPNKEMIYDGYTLDINLEMEKGNDDYNVNLTGKVLFNELRVNEFGQESPYYYVPVEDNIPE